MGIDQKLKEVLSAMPLMMDFYWHVYGSKKPWKAHYNLNTLKQALSQSVWDAATLKTQAPKGKRIFMFAGLHYWIEQTVMMGLALSGLGHDVSFAYLPYSTWQKRTSKFDLKRQDLYTHDVLKPLSSVMRVLPLIDAELSPITDEIQKIAHEVAVFDTQYTLQVEEIQPDDPIYQLRFERNLHAGRAFYAWLQGIHPDVVIVPNGTVHELAVLYRVSQLLGIRTVTFEFGDQKERIWLAQDQEIMRQNTDALWQHLGDTPITEAHQQTLIDLYAARKNAKLWGNFARKWQGTPTEGALELRRSLYLDERPIVMLATNVLGDSLTLGRQAISETMAEWILNTIRILQDREDIQLIIRIHPGELLTRGMSMLDVINQEFPHLPAHMHLIKPDEKVNTYDLIAIADLGLVYTTTVGLEMAMAGVPVIVSGKTHYRGRGFTIDPQTWSEYEQKLNLILNCPQEFRMTDEQVELAWRYAYLFFFEFPFIFPWHLVYLNEDMDTKPLAFVLSEAGREIYGETFRFLAGEAITYRFRR